MDWLDNSKDGIRLPEFKKRPLRGAVSIDHDLVAISFAVEPIHLLSLSTGKLLETVDRAKGKGARSETFVLEFNPNPDLHALVVSYETGGALCVYDIERLTLKYQNDGVNARVLAFSSDGLTLATGGNHGRLCIFDCDVPDGASSLPMIFQVKIFTMNMRGLAFSDDNLGILEIGMDYCHFWDPPVLVRNTMTDSQSDLSRPVKLSPVEGSSMVSSRAPRVTTIACSSSASHILVGKDTREIYVYPLTGKDGKLLYKHKGSIRAIKMSLSGKVAVSADNSANIVVMSLKSNGAEASGLAIDVLIDRVYGESVSDVLLNKEGTRLFVCGVEGTSELWDVPAGRVLRTFKLQDKSGWKTLFNLGDCTAQFMIKTQAGPVKVFTWSDLREVVVSEQTLDTVAAANIASKNASNLAETLDILTLLSVSGSTILFLDAEMWVCSVTVNPDTTNLLAVKRLFFIPPRWTDWDNEVLFSVAPSRRFVLSTQRGIVVIQCPRDLQD